MNAVHRLLGPLLLRLLLQNTFSPLFVQGLIPLPNLLHPVFSPSAPASSQLDVDFPTEEDCVMTSERLFEVRCRVEFQKGKTLRAIGGLFGGDTN